MVGTAVPIVPAPQAWELESARGFWEVSLRKYLLPPDLRVGGAGVTIVTIKHSLSR